MGDIKKFRLNTSPKESPLLFGLLTDVRDYKITWILNQTLGIGLRRVDDLVWSHKKLAQKQSFPHYKDTETSLGTVQLIQNNSSEMIRIPEYRHVDYLLLINNLPGLLDETNWINMLRTNPEIRGIYKLDPIGLQDLLE
ncbi:MAG: IPExxxVDY family protein [Bacteroidales bacterium]|nr:IPExxxVDY family protein [Bacteroidales bacterium]